jgi:type 2 lantibiotic biosynthesis protein LanM
MPMTPTSPNTKNRGPATWPSPVWWAPALALHERTGTPTDSTHGLDMNAVAVLRAESSEDLAARVQRPAWVATVERAVAAATPVVHTANTWRDAFATVLAPFAEDALQRITCASEHVDLAGVTAQVGATLKHHLVNLAVRTLVTEMHRLSAEGRLAGEDSRARFLDFVNTVSLVEVLSRYPVLARLLAQASSATVTATLELLDRFAADRALIVETLLDGVDPGQVTGIVAGRGDRHHGGRSVAFVDFADGQRIVYKPRDVTTQVRVREFLDLLAAKHPELCPRAVATLTRPGYGWSEFSPARELADKSGAERFYRRQGALLALAHVLRTTDMHYENVIADGDTPVLIDTETLFNAELLAGGTGDPATDMLGSSVYRTALLPLIVVGESGVADLSGLGGDRGAHCPTSVVDWLDAGTDRMRLTRRAIEMTGSANRPRLDGADLDPGDHEQAMVTGFRQTYDFIATHRADFAALVSACADLEIRVITRPSWMYGTLLDETTHPDVLGDALDRDEALSVLYANRAAHPLFGRLIPHEIAAMWDGDVPMFLASAGSGELRLPGGTPLPVSLPKAGVTAALDTLATMDEVDRHAQEWVISATLATRRDAPAHPPAEVLPALPANPVVHPDTLITAARAMADKIIAHSAGDEKINWLGLEHVDGQWLVLPMGASLGTGYLGVAVFLAQLAEVTGITRYADQARRAVADASALTDTFVNRPELAEAAGWGGLTGLGGITYGLARLGNLLDDPTLRNCAERLTELAAKSAATTTDLGWASGLAGCLAAMSAVHVELGCEQAATVVADCADRLADVADRDAGTLPLPFADGLAGAAWALTRLGTEPRHREIGRRLAAEVAARGESLAGGWCHGGPGLALAASCAPEQISMADATAMAGGPVRRDLSLCHGEIGVTEVLATIAGPGTHRSPTARALSRRTGQVLEVLRRHGPVCGVPGNVPTPDILTGFAGIGYGLLRLAARQDVPSILLLQPATN